MSLQQKYADGALIPLYTPDPLVLNKRKQELLKKLEKEITIDAIKNKNFEIFKIN